MRSLRKIPTRLRGTNFCTSSARFTPSFVRQPNGPEFTQIVPNAPKCQLWSNRVDRVRSRKIPMRLRSANFCTSSAHFAPSFLSQPNGHQCTKIVRNAPDHEFRVQWVGSGAFVVKNSDNGSWHELLHHFGPFSSSFVSQLNGPKCTKIL